MHPNAGVAPSTEDELTAFLALLDEGGFVKPETALCPETGRFEKLVLCEDGSQALEQGRVQETGDVVKYF